jgi:hypothetical protein
LPSPTTQPEFLLLNDVITELIDFAHGATVSSLNPPVFDGWWLDQGRSIQDANVMIIADVAAEPDVPALIAYLDRLKRRCQHDFDQDIVWLTVHPIDRIATDDRVR